ncbi:hypothetical protein BLNAU_12228 [Blattamonas nauphoetae]|uniref:Selenoprotein F n=1 Tax=Blattamonas nauphoetae TaxID=2049346 RepID=A0ABQ9XMN9_9EUKA|nr:hypothetical protein BLNAU_12228 [Blattamonas nauphoetae]
MTLQLLYLLLLTCVKARTPEEQEECLANGFDSTVLECSTCSIVKKYTNENLVAMCKKCCNKFNIEKYPKAAFEYDEQMITSELYGFIENEAKTIPNLEIRKRSGAIAEIHLYNSKGDDIEHFSCIEWSTKEVIQYLSEKLRRY